MAEAAPKSIFDIQPFPLMPKFSHIPRSFAMRMMRENRYPHNFDIYCTMCGITLKPWQRQECLNMIEKDEYLINWGRGMSKTLLFTLVCGFDALCGLKTVYLVPRTDELVQPIEYFNANPFIDFNPHKQNGNKVFIIEKSRWFYVFGRPMIKISNIDDKGFNVSSGRFSRVKYDECALLMYYVKEVELFNKAAGMLRSQPFPHKCWSSTPLIGSHFVTMLEDKKEHHPDEYSWRNFENTPDNFLTDTPEKKRIIEREHADAIRLGIEYAWITENLAIPMTASGAAYKNYVDQAIADFPSQLHNRVGTDFHGYAVGHIWVAIYYNPDAEPNHVYVIAEGCEKYKKEANADESMIYLQRPFFDCELFGEGDITNMVNGPFLKAGLPWGMSNVRIAGYEKYNLESNVLQFTWHIDKTRTPLFYNDYTNAQWADTNKFILHKMSSGMKFRNHYLDAAMTALPKSRGDNIFVPNRSLHFQTYIAQDRAAHKVYRGRR